MFRNIRAVVVVIVFSIVLVGCNEGKTSSTDSIKTENAVEDNSTTNDGVIDAKEAKNDIDVNTKPGEVNDEKEIVINDKIYNCSLELADKDDSNKAKGWSINSWGNHDAIFDYLDEGHTGERCVMVEVSNYVDGDAKWYFEPIELEAGDYSFSDYYRSNVDSKVMIIITTKEGKTEFVNLYNAPASENWKRYEASFVVPDYAKDITVFHLLSQEGYLIVDDYQISEYSYEGFSQGLITISFDDGWITNSETALPIMQEYGYKSNQFYATKYIQDYKDGNPFDLIKPFVDAGHEMGSHTVNHADLSKLSDNELMAELIESKIFLENYLMTDIDYFAAPYGIYDAKVNEKILENYKAHRTVDYGYNSKDNFDISKLTCMPVVSDTTVDDVKKWVQKAKDENLWLILLFHNIKDEPANYGSTPEMFAECMQVIDDADIPVVTISEAIEMLEEEID